MSDNNTSAAGRHWNRVIAAVVWFALVLAIGVPARSFTERNRRLEEITRAVASARPVEALSSEWLSPAWYAEGPLPEREAWQDAERQNVLLIFVRGDCEACSLALAKWFDAIAGLPPGRAPTVVVAFPFGEAPPNLVTTAQATLPVFVRHVSDPDRLRCALGVRSVPMSVLVTQAGCVRVAALGVPKDETVSLTLRTPAGSAGSLLTEYQQDTMPFVPVPSTRAEWFRNLHTITGGSHASSPE